MANDQTFSIVISKVQNEQGILLFVHWSDNLKFKAPVRTSCLKFWSPKGK